METYMQKMNDPVNLVIVTDNNIVQAIMTREQASSVHYEWGCMRRRVAIKEPGWEEDDLKLKEGTFVGSSVAQDEAGADVKHNTWAVLISKIVGMYIRELQNG